MDTIDESIEGAKNQLNGTNMLKQQLENKSAILKEQIKSAHMNDRTYAQRRLPFSLNRKLGSSNLRN